MNTVHQFLNCSGIFDSSISSVNLFTLRYQGIDVSTYVRVLSAAGVGVVVEVRETAWSHKRDFCKTALTSELFRAGTEYVHLPSAGNSKENRRTAKNNAECLRRYQEYLAKNPVGVNDLVNVIKRTRARRMSVCLTCFERESRECHRSILVGHSVAAFRNYDRCIWNLAK